MRTKWNKHAKVIPQHKNFPKQFRCIFACMSGNLSCWKNNWSLPLKSFRLPRSMNQYICLCIGYLCMYLCCYVALEYLRPNIVFLFLMIQLEKSIYLSIYLSDWLFFRGLKQSSTYNDWWQTACSDIDWIFESRHSSIYL